MSNPKKKSFPSRDSLITLFGVFLCLIGVLLLLSPSSHFLWLGYAVFFPFGWPGFLLAGVLILGSGILTICHTGIRYRPSGRLIAGLFVMALGLCPMMTDLAYEGSEQIANFHHFIEETESALGMLDGLTQSNAYRGGLLGFVISGALNEYVGRWLVILVYVFILAVGFFLSTYPLWRQLVFNARAKAVAERARKEKLDEEKENDPFLERDSVPDFDGHKKDVQVFHYEKNPQIEPELEQGEKSEREENKPLVSHPVFVRAGKNVVIPTAGNESTDKIYPNPIVTPAPTPSPASYRDKPLQRTGLVHAFFDARSFGEKTQQKPAEPVQVEEKEEEEIVPTPHEGIETSAIIPDFIMEKTEKESASMLVPEPSLPEEREEANSLPEPESIVPPATPETVQNRPVSAVSSAIPTPSLAPPSVQQAPATSKSPADPYAEIPNADPWPEYVFPSLDLLSPSTENDPEALASQKEEADRNTAIINQFFTDFKIGAHVVNLTIGAAFTQYEIQPDASVSVSSISSRIKDLEMRLGGISSNFTEHVVGSTTCAIEVPNSTHRSIAFRDAFVALKEGSKMQIPFGVDIKGNLIQGNLADFPHMLVAGTSGSGKSVFLHGMLCSLIMRNRPEELRLVMIDPKGVEMTMYENIPHLLCPVIKDPKESIECLSRLCEEMDRRYRIMGKAHYRDIKTYNQSFAKPKGKRVLPYIVCVIDEFADLMQTAKSVADHVARLTAKARSAGIHLVVATQHPSVDVISGKIKSNLDTRVAMSVSSFTDSMTIINQSGAENLLGHGDMLVMCPKVAAHRLIRAQGVLVTDEELNAICEYVSAEQQQNFDAHFLDLGSPSVSFDLPNPAAALPSGGTSSSPQNAPGAGPNLTEMTAGNAEDKYQMVKASVMAMDFCSMSRIVREFGVGYSRAGKFYKRLQEEGILEIGDSANNSKGARVLIHAPIAAESEAEEGPRNILNLPEGF